MVWGGLVFFSHGNQSSTLNSPFLLDSGCKGPNAVQLFSGAITSTTEWHDSIIFIWHGSHVTCAHLSSLVACMVCIYFITGQWNYHMTLQHAKPPDSTCNGCANVFIVVLLGGCPCWALLAHWWGQVPHLKLTIWIRGLCQGSIPLFFLIPWAFKKWNGWS